MRYILAAILTIITGVLVILLIRNEPLCKKLGDKLENGVSKILPFLLFGMLAACIFLTFYLIISLITGEPIYPRWGN